MPEQDAIWIATTVSTLQLGPITCNTTLRLGNQIPLFHTIQISGTLCCFCNALCEHFCDCGYVHGGTFGYVVVWDLWVLEDTCDCGCVHGGTFGYVAVWDLWVLEDTAVVWRQCARQVVLHHFGSKRPLLQPKTDPSPSLLPFQTFVTFCPVQVFNAIPPSSSILLFHICVNFKWWHIFNFILRVIAGEKKVFRASIIWKIPWEADLMLVMGNEGEYQHQIYS